MREREGEKEREGERERERDSGWLLLVKCCERHKISVGLESGLLFISIKKRKSEWKRERKRKT